jgi:Uma2 family endonuclease
MKLPAKGGQARISSDDHIEGAPELVVETVGSSRAYDLHQKKGAYRRNGVREYLAWITPENRIVRWELHDGDFREIVPDAHGLLKEPRLPRPLAQLRRAFARRYEGCSDKVAKAASTARNMQRSFRRKRL